MKFALRSLLRIFSGDGLRCSCVEEISFRSFFNLTKGVPVFMDSLFLRRILRVTWLPDFWEDF